MLGPASLFLEYIGLRVDLKARIRETESSRQGADCDKYRSGMRIGILDRHRYDVVLAKDRWVKHAASQLRT